MGQLLVVNFGEIKNWTKIDVIQGCLFLNTLPLAVYLHIGMVLKTLPLAVSCQYSLIRSDNFMSTFFFIAPNLACGLQVVLFDWV